MVGVVEWLLWEEGGRNKVVVLNGRWCIIGWLIREEERMFVFVELDKMDVGMSDVRIVEGLDEKDVVRKVLINDYKLGRDEVEKSIEDWKWVNGKFYCVGDEVDYMVKKM